MPSLLMSVNGWISSGSIKFRERKRESQEERERENKVTYPAIQTNHAKNKDISKI